MDMASARELLDKYNVLVRLVNLPPGYRGTVNKHGAGYAIAIAEYLSPAARERTLIHELYHIILGHLDDRYDLSEEEKESEVRYALRAMGY